MKFREIFELAEVIPVGTRSYDFVSRAAYHLTTHNSAFHVVTELKTAKKFIGSIFWLDFSFLSFLASMTPKKRTTFWE